MLIECPNCGTKNSVTGELSPDKTYRCGNCNSIITILQTDNVRIENKSENPVAKVIPTNPEEVGIVLDEKAEPKHRNPTLKQLSQDLTSNVNLNKQEENKLNPTLDDVLYGGNSTATGEIDINKDDLNNTGKTTKTLSDRSGEEKIGLRYYALRIISIFLRILAVIVLIAGIVISAYMYSQGNRDSTSKYLLTAGIIGSIAGGIIIFANGELIKLFIDVEANTRATELNTKRRK
jgi:hypothetical protein